jgi:hypothetical protein
MSLIKSYFRELFTATRDGWNRFWFTPADPATYCLIRILAGAMLLYTHLVWTLGLEDFFGPSPWVSREALDQFSEVGPFAFSLFRYVESPAWLWGIHLAALVVFTLLTLGLYSRVMSVAACVLALSYANRVPAALFGLDQINCMLALYLVVGPCGACWSLDAWRRRRAARALAARSVAPRPGVLETIPPVRSETLAADGYAVRLAPSIAANVAIRLMQVHLCVVYLFAGLGKLQGMTWWRGDAVWWSAASLEYQSLDMTWLADWPVLVSLLTHLTVWWEASYAVLVWPRWTRPLVLAMAVPVHLGIALCFGMITFGLAMLIANVAFVPPELLRRVLRRGASQAEREVATEGDAAPPRRQRTQRQRDRKQQHHR